MCRTKSVVSPGHPGSQERFHLAVLPTPVIAVAPLGLVAYTQSGSSPSPGGVKIYTQWYCGIFSLHFTLNFTDFGFSRKNPVSRKVLWLPIIIMPRLVQEAKRLSGQGWASIQLVLGLLVKCLDQSETWQGSLCWAGPSHKFQAIHVLANAHNTR